MEAFVDWLQFTFMRNLDSEYDVSPYDVISEVLRLKVQDFVDGNGLYGYKSCLEYQNIRVLYDGTDFMGIHVQISGQGCRFMETVPGFDWNDFIGWLEFYGVLITRCDIAIDQTEYFDMDKVKKYISAGNVVTKFKQYGERQDKSIRTAEVLGDTLYLGSKASSLFIRIYDKEKESGGKIKGTRLEIVLKDERAQAFMKAYLENENFYNLSYLTGKVLNNYLRFIAAGDCRNTDRKTVRWWGKFVGHLERLSLGKGKGKMTLDKVCKWLESQVSSSLKLIYETKGRDYVEDMVKRATLSNTQFSMKKEYEEKVLKIG